CPPRHASSVVQTSWSSHALASGRGMLTQPAVASHESALQSSQVSAGAGVDARSSKVSDAAPGSLQRPGPAVSKDVPALGRQAFEGFGVPGRVAALAGDVADHDAFD